MSDYTLSRRTFVGCAGGALALAAAGGVALGSTTKNGHPVYPTRDELDTWSANGLCSACPNLCSYAAYVNDSQVGKLIANGAHPNTRGSLCARGYAASKTAYAPDRLTEPQRRDASGNFTAVSWDDALNAIGGAFAQAAERDAASVAAIHGVEPTAAFYSDRLMAALGSANVYTDPASVDASKLAGYAQVIGAAAIHGVEPTAAFYSDRLMAALGSANVYTDPASVDASKLAGYAQVIGATGWAADAAKTKMMLVLGEDPTGMSPAETAQLKAAKDAGASVVYAGPVLTGASVLATEWVPVTQGAQLALVLALCNRLVADGSYDADFVAQNTTGFEAFAEGVATYTPQWAEDVAGVPASTVVRLARQLSNAAPAALVVDGGLGASGLANSGELARAVCALNTLLGCWNQPGGALLYRANNPSDLGDLALETPTAACSAAELYPLALPGIGSAVAAVESGELGALLLVDSDLAGDGGNAAKIAQALEKIGCVVALDWRMSDTAKLADWVLAKIAQALEKIGCVVALDWRMSDTAKLADWVLPVAAPLEFEGMPAFIDAPTPVVAFGDQAIDPVVEGPRSVSSVIEGIANAAGVGAAFEAGLEAFAEAELAGTGISLAALRTNGTLALPNSAFSYGVYDLATPSGSFELASDACAAAGLSAAPGWVSPELYLDDEHVNVMVLSLPTQTGTASAAVPGLAAVADDYDLGRLWLNAAQAAKLGIADADVVEITTSDGRQARGRVMVTERVVPGLIVVPAGFSAEDAESGRAVSAAGLASDTLEKGYGAPVTRSVTAVVKKAGA